MAAGKARPARIGRGFASRSFAATTPAELMFTISPPQSPTMVISPSLQLTTQKRRETDSGWKAGLLGVQRALEAEFGPLPYPHVSVVEVPNAIAEKAGFGAVASPGAILARSDFIDQPFNVAAFAHEFAHLWWGHLVGLRGEKGDFLLDEGLSQYASMVAVDRVLGPSAGSRYRSRGLPGFNESLFSALGYLKISAADIDRPLLALEDDGLSYWIAYSKAGLAWNALAEQMGRENFSGALRDVLAEYGASYVTWDEFLAVLQRRSPSSLQPFIDAWFREPGAPSYRLEWRQQGDFVSGRVTGCGNIKPATLELETRFADGQTSRRKIMVSSAGAQFRFLAGGVVQGMMLDPDYKILRWTPELRTEAEAMAEYMRASALARVGKKDEAERVLLAWLERSPTDNGYDRLLLTRANLVRLAQERGCRSCAVVHLKAALAVQPLRPEQLAVTYQSLASAAKRLAQPTLAAEAARRARLADALVGNANGVDAKLDTLGI
jgi:tetratricopeptide (TPR) repeat protein